ncbi:MAG: glutamine--fructose-6-phosphate aminotransferase, partial [Gemmatimonadetes bacterium]|nr:glutamine--fructose-6-phosphate aminotransferase [Gemmatimonadota bacterium]
MCGIIAYAGKARAAPILMDGLRSLEYRGYDSAGIAVLRPDGRFQVIKRPGRVSDLAADLEHADLQGTVG